MSDGLQIRKDGELDFLSLGALVHRLIRGLSLSARRQSARFTSAAASLMLRLTSRIALA